MCTNISIKRRTKEESLISARTMDFTIEIPTVISFVPRQQSFPKLPLKGEIKWKNKYAFVGTLHQYLKQSGYSDGLNETGLSAAALWLEATKYKTPILMYNILSVHNVISYILGNFKDVEEAESALSKVKIIDPVKPIKIPIHIIISDSAGDHLIVEFMNGKIKTYINRMGVLTNDPPLDWHITNLCNYKNLSLYNIPESCPNFQLYGTGQFGSPGDSTSPSRFVRAELLRKGEFKASNPKESIGLARQILQTLAEPCGTVMLANKSGFDWTQWIVIRDHTNISYYFSTAFNSTLYGIHINELDLDSLIQKEIPIKQSEWYVDYTDKF
ncbi:linear amide C-N hydrolase [Clostridium sp. SHJSY1]|uniref:linear amide C-N hydrolase n=1 Tax=Clostridium sp. SHJSY1 TaxID=2942483 RepID=UPI0028740620|nr:linear amide C-N hydrolase [Clostridium sp. SHJSY1]MDS0525271.1 linear amide C-N hydrolase [Clostridium sp. SHJSY1]